MVNHRVLFLCMDVSCGGALGCHIVLFCFELLELHKNGVFIMFECLWVRSVLEDMTSFIHYFLEIML